MDYQVRENGQQVTVLLTGELDMTVGEKVGSLIRKVGSLKQNITIDFQQVTFVDSSGIGNLFFTIKDLLADGKSVEIVNIREEVLDILHILGFTEALDVKIKPLDQLGSV